MLERRRQWMRLRTNKRDSIRVSPLAPPTAGPSSGFRLFLLLHPAPSLRLCVPSPVHYSLSPPRAFRAPFFLSSCPFPSLSFGFSAILLPLSGHRRPYRTERCRLHPFFPSALSRNLAVCDIHRDVSGFQGCSRCGPLAF